MTVTLKRPLSNQVRERSGTDFCLKADYTSTNILSETNLKISAARVKLLLEH